VPVDDPRWEDVKNIEDVNKHTLKTMKHFYENYKKLQNKEVIINGFDGIEEANAAVKRSHDMYTEKYAK